VKVRLDRTSAHNTGGAGVDTLANVESVTGSAFDDYLKGDSQANGLDGGAGNDVLDGGAGADVMRGNAGDDFYYVDNVGDLVVELSGEGSDRVQAFIDCTLADNVENLTLKGAAATTGTGNALANVIRGTTADNTLNGLGGIDELFGREGDDILSGGGSGDRLEGEAGRDTIDGGGGNDLIVGGTQKDTLTGGAGADTFFFGDGEVGSGASSADIVTDFSQAEGDKIHLRRIDANTGSGGDQNFTFIGTGAFTGVAGQLHYLQAGGNTFVEGDTDGDGTVDFVIRLDGLVNLAAGDFVL
jgi:Ca2+-binding RTX toxin-like protein